MSNRFVPYKSNLKARAQELRKNATPAERRFWSAWKQTQQHQEHTLTRQKPLDNYIADFYCAKLKLVIEIDGASHYTPEAQEYDARRTLVLQKYKLNVLRFTNTEVEENIEGVMERVFSYIEDFRNPL